MLRAMSSYVYIKRRLHPGLLESLVRGGAQAIELFAARGHFNYDDKEHVRELGNWFRSEKIEFHSMHSPIYMSNDFRSGGPMVNIVDPDKRMRIEAMDEIKRAIEVAVRGEHFNGLGPAAHQVVQQAGMQPALDVDVS